MCISFVIQGDGVYQYGFLAVFVSRTITVCTIASGSVYRSLNIKSLKKLSGNNIVCDIITCDNDMNFFYNSVIFAMVTNTIKYIWG
uniref:Uncharacterized protein n=1 Tax=Oryza brachyantha TaxID=4533 RepID=J3NCC1_ORYBR